MSSTTQVPTFRISLSSPSPAQQRLDSLLEQESEFNNNLSNTSFYNNPAISTTPPAYSTGEENDHSIPKYPTQAHIPSSELPTYDHATIDMPPSYGSHNNKDNEVAYDTFLTNDLPWPITKKLYIIGFVFWPLWLVGMGFSIFGKKNETRKWGRRCAWNSLIIMLVFAYMVVAYIRTNGRIVM